MKKLTSVERRILRAMDIMHITAYIAAAAGFIIMCCGCSRYEQDIATFFNCIIWTIVGFAILMAAIGINYCIERLHDEFCYQLDIFDWAGYKRLSYTCQPHRSRRDQKILEERLMRDNQKMQEQQDRQNQKQWDTYFANGGYDLRKMYPDESVIPVSEGNIRIMSLNSGKPE